MFLFLKIIFILANSIEPDEMLRTTTFHLGYHSLQKYRVRGFQCRKGHVYSNEPARGILTPSIDSEQHVLARSLASLLCPYNSLAISIAVYNNICLFYSPRKRIQPVTCMECEKTTNDAMKFSYHFFIF